MSGSKENKQEALQKENEYKVTWKGWVSLAFLIISFSGLVAHQDNFLKAFDLMNLMGQFGHADGAKIAMQGTGGFGAAIKFQLVGKPAKWVSGKDVILHIIGMIGFFL